MMTIDQAIDKARKLLALATSDNANEAATAAGMAQAILDRYDLDMAMVESSADEPNEEIENFANKGAPLYMGGTVPAWQGSLADHIAKANGCRVYTSRSDKKRTIEIVGHASNVQKVRYLFSYLVAEVERLTRRDGRGCGRTWQNNFRHGAVKTIGEALAASRAAAEAELRAQAGTNETTLVRIDNAIAKIAKHGRAVDLYCQVNLNLRAVSSQVRSSKSAYAQGREAGREVSIGSARGALGTGTRQLN